MVASLISTVVTGACLTFYLSAQRTFENVQSSSSLLHSGQRMLSQMTREIKMAGFPSSESLSATAVASFPGIVADSFVVASDYDLAFEADLDGDGQVEQVEYLLPDGSATIERRLRRKNLDGTLASSMLSEPLVSKVQNRIQGKPLFRWQIDPASSKPFPKNIRIVFVNLVLKSEMGQGRPPAELTLAATCPRMNP